MARRATLWVLLPLIFVACSSADPTSIPAPTPGITPNNDPTTTIALFYNDISLVLYNGGDDPIAPVDALAFVRGEDGAGDDDYAGGRIPGGELAPGACFQLAQQGRTPLAPRQCDNTDKAEFIINPDTYFWRAEPVGAATFEVHWAGELVHRCATVQRGQVAECRFSLP